MFEIFYSKREKGTTLNFILKKGVRNREKHGHFSFGRAF